MSDILDYDQLVFLDAENLAEAGMREAYESLLPELQKYVPQPAQVEELIDNDVGRDAGFPAVFGGIKSEGGGVCRR